MRYWKGKKAAFIVRKTQGNCVLIGIQLPGKYKQNFDARPFFGKLVAWDGKIHLLLYY